MEVYKDAVGPCFVCGEDTEGSQYWTPLPANIWNTVRPFLAPLFHDDFDRITTLFIPAHSKPFCGALCVQEYYRRVAADNLKKGN